LKTLPNFNFTLQTAKNPIKLGYDSSASWCDASAHRWRAIALASARIIDRNSCLVQLLAPAGGAHCIRCQSIVLSSIANVKQFVKTQFLAKTDSFIEQFLRILGEYLLRLSYEKLIYIEFCIVNEKTFLAVLI
jgi:hypothetical protein